MKIGYARVSTDDQNLALQHDALQAEGCEVIHDDKLSGASWDRPGLKAALAACKPGDVLVAWKLDRLGRSTAELVKLADDLNKREVGLKILTGQGAAIDTTQPAGRLVYAVFAAVAEFERELTRERTRAGITAAKRRGIKVGRKPSITPEKIEMAQRLIAEGKGKAIAARMIGVGPATLRRALNDSRMPT